MGIVKELSLNQLAHSVLLVVNTGISHKIISGMYAIEAELMSGGPWLLGSWSNAIRGYARANLEMTKPP